MPTTYDFFISYRPADRTWAEWIAWHLEEHGYTTAIQAWDFRPGSSFVSEMQKSAAASKRTIAVLSPDYLEGAFTQSEWAAAFARDPTGQEKKLLPIRVRECSDTGLLGQIVYIDLVGVEEEGKAAEILLSGVRKERVKPSQKPHFPPGVARPAETYTPYFPNASTTLYDKYSELLKAEFQMVISRRESPAEDSNSCALLFGHRFPFGKDKTAPLVSRCAVAFDIEQLLAATVGSYQAPNVGVSGSFVPSIAYKAASVRWRILVSLVAKGESEFRDDVLLDPLVEGISSKEIERNVPFSIQQTARAYVQNDTLRVDYVAVSRLLFLIGIICRDNGVDLPQLLAEEQRKHRYHLRSSRSGRLRTAQSSLIAVHFKDHQGAYEVILKALADYRINIVASRSWTLVPQRVAYTELELSYPAGTELKRELEYVFSKPDVYSNVYHYTIVK